MLDVHVTIEGVVAIAILIGLIWFSRARNAAWGGATLGAVIGAVVGMFKGSVVNTAVWGFFIGAGLGLLLEVSARVGKWWFDPMRLPLFSRFWSAKQWERAARKLDDEQQRREDILARKRQREREEREQARK
jgi:hypothetical protein